MFRRLIKETPKYLISGVAPGKGGVGGLLKSLDSRKNGFNYRSVYVRNPITSISYLLKNKKILTFSSELTLWLCSLIVAHLRMLLMRNKTVILIYPQYFNGYVLASLVKNNNVALYVMDNSFFCIKSYNYLDGEECVKCLFNADEIDESCTPFPKLSSKKGAIKKIETIGSVSEAIYFLAQNNQQFNLLRKSFGSNLRGAVVGMDTGEFHNQPVRSLRQGYDIVYHGSADDAKGIMYVLKLAENLKQYTFLIPISENSIKLEVELSNVHFKECGWLSGLKEFTMTARLVLCPSIWSAPIESALLKSIAYNGNVAVYDNDYGFQNDIDCKYLLRLNKNVINSCSLINEFMMSDCNNHIHTQKWLKSYCANLDDKDIFEWELTAHHKRVKVKHLIN
jgi:hypothetical protein